MKTKYPFWFLFILTAFLLISSCEDNEDSKRTKSDNEVNQWIYREMSIYYLWNNHLPKSPNYDQNPKDFFYKSLCYNYNEKTNPEGDRFSFIQENYTDLIDELSGIVAEEVGFEYSLGLTQDGYVIGEIEYIKPKTPAERVGLRRGQIFSRVNGLEMRESNYQTILTSIKGDYTLTLHNVYMDGGNATLSTPFEERLSTVSKYIDNPFYLNTIYTVGSKKIGYLIYNFFASDSNDESLSFDKQMIDVFNEFKSEGVTDMIVDLRYNSGGSVNSAQCLASMLVKDRSTDKIFIKTEYNAFLTNEFEKAYGSDSFNTYFIDKTTPPKSSAISLPNIGNQLDHLVFLTGHSTASASEMVINSLLPYNTKITLIGNTTVGKNVGSITIYDEDNADKNKWAIQPIVVKFYNAVNSSDFTSGFTPDRLNQDIDYPKKELGDVNENLLSDAIAFITGNQRRSFIQDDTQQPLFRQIDSSTGNKAWSNKSILNLKDLPKITTDMLP